MNNRKYYLDVLRIVAILQVINIHVVSGFFNNIKIFGTNEWWTSNLINTLSRTGVSIFIMISGAVMLGNKKEEKIEIFFKKRICKIAIPFLFWCGFYFFGMNNKYMFDLNNIKDFILSIIQNKIYYHLWFMYYIIGLYLTFPIINIYVKNAFKNQLLYFEVLCWIIGLIPFINYVFNIQIGIIIPIAGGAIGMFVLGFILDSNVFSVKSRYLLYFFGITSSILTFYGNYFISRNGAITQILFENWGINIIIMASALFIFIKQLCIKYLIENSIFKKILITISNLSFGIYLIHVYILTMLEQGKISFLLPQYMPCTFFGLLSRTISVFIISFTIVYIISKIKYVRRIV